MTEEDDMIDTKADAFGMALDAWKTHAITHAKAKEEYRVKHAKAFAESQGKTESARKAEADMATTAERLARDLAEVEMLAAYHTMIFLRGSAGEPQR